MNDFKLQHLSNHELIAFLEYSIQKITVWEYRDRIPHTVDIESHMDSKNEAINELLRRLSEKAEGEVLLTHSHNHEALIGATSATQENTIFKGDKP